MRIFTEMTLVCYKSSELDSTIVAPIWSNPEYRLEQPVDCSSTVIPGNAVAPASGTYMMFRDPLHPEFPFQKPTASHKCVLLQLLPVHSRLVDLANLLCYSVPFPVVVHRVMATVQSAVIVYDHVTAKC